MGDFVRQRRDGDFVGVPIRNAIVFTFGVHVRIAFGLSFVFAIDLAVRVSFQFAFGDVRSVVSGDLTILYLTVNAMPLMWQQFHMGHLLRAAEGRPMVVISKEPMELGRPDTEYLIQSGPYCAWNVYRQLLRGAKLADTQYVAVAEDDTLYPAKHFSDFRPPDDAVAYDMSRWSVFSWVKQPFFSAIRKCGNFSMIGPRKLVIDALKEREEKYPDGHDYAGEIGRADVERRLKVGRRNRVEWYCTEPMVNLCHPRGLSPTYTETRGLERKPGELKSLECPIWGKASDIAAIYNQGAAEELPCKT